MVMIFGRKSGEKSRFGGDKRGEMVRVARVERTLCLLGRRPALPVLCDGPAPEALVVVLSQHVPKWFTVVGRGETLRAAIFPAS